MEEIDIEFGWPTVDEAMPLLSQRLRSLKQNGVKTAKIIHGYGSSGKGGTLRKATLQMLDSQKRRGLIREYIMGEQWTKFECRTLRLIDRTPNLYKDKDFEKYNRGITIVFL